MLPSNPIETMNVYASQSQYVKGPDKAAQVAGTVPLDTLPADWWNWLWKQITTRINEASSGMGSVYNEILSVLEEASITPSETSTTDLVNAIKAIAHTIGSSTTAGAVKSSATSGYVAIDADGYMTPNGMGVPTSLNTSSKQIVGAINEVLASFNSYKTTNDHAITGLGNSKAPNNHASTETTYGVGSSTNYGHVKLSDATDGTEGESDGVAATPAAVATVQTNLTTCKNTLESQLSQKAGLGTATQDSNGLMSSSDKRKLDGVPTFAEGTALLSGYVSGTSLYITVG